MLVRGPDVDVRQYKKKYTYTCITIDIKAAYKKMFTSRLHSFIEL